MAKDVPKIVKLFPGYEVEELPWGAACKNLKTNKYEILFFHDGQELDVTHWEIILHDNGLEFVSFDEK